MAPSKEPHEEEAPEDAEGREKFNSSLSDFASDRGISVDFHARVAGKHIDLFRLWKLITSRGGYDAVTSEKLAWRRVGHDFNLGSTNAAAYAFALKTLYYKNLVAYEIKVMHGQEPPPVAILEKITAKGGDTLSRTVENFQPPPPRNGVANGASESEDEGSKTPKEEKMDTDDPGSGGGRVTRGLRQAPAPRQLFQPDVSASRQTRHSSSHLQSPQPTPLAHTGYNYSASSNPNSASFAIQNYEPRPPMALTLRPVLTPANNLAMFKERQRAARDARKAELGLLSPTTKGMMKPGAGFEGPNIYVRTLQGLRSQVSEEQDYALHHLVKISHERGDKYKFDAFPNLAEGLVEYVLGISSLFYEVDWEICYSEDRHGLNILDGINGTPDILQKLQHLKRVDRVDDMESNALAHKLTKTLEAGLTIRNLSFLEDNAKYLSEMPQLRDFLSIALNLPALPMVSEMKHYALEIAEQVTKYWSMDEFDPLYRSLIAQIDEGQDRGAILIALRAISRISMIREERNLLRGIPVSVVRQLCEWVFLEDDELVGACLDFFYQFTAVPENLAFLLSNSNDIPLPSLIAQLARLLQHNSTTQHVNKLTSHAVSVTAATEIPSVPDDLLREFLKFDEPDRSNHWLRSVFEEDPESFITQIQLWQAYQFRFTEHTSSQVQLLPAAEFIKNVSTIFVGANAQVVNGPSPKFIIKGIRPRHAPVDLKQRPYSRCLWKAPDSGPCTEFFMQPKTMFNHIASSHLGIDRNEDGSWNLASGSQAAQCPPDCFWADCRQFSKRDGVMPTAYELGMHVKTHLPDQSGKAQFRQKHNRTAASRRSLSAQEGNGSMVVDGASPVDPQQGREAKYHQYRYENTADAHGKADGLSLPSILVLRMIVRNIPKAATLLRADDRENYCRDVMKKMFEPLMDRFIFAYAYNKPLTAYISEVEGYIEKASSL